ncbi:MAG: AMP-binding protein [Clostridia bacterium]|nr:AMP-binding protein [Clostridia bacterium]
MEELKNLNSLKDIINVRFDLFKDKVAFIEKDADHKEFEHIKYSQIKEKINGLGTYMLKELNLKGEKVAVIGENSYRWYVTYMAVACGVGIIVPLDKGLPEHEILNLLQRSGAKAIVYSSRKKDEINSLKKDLSKDMIYIEMNKKESDEESIAFDRIIEKGIKMVDSGDRTYIDAQIDREAFSILLFTSGTSASAKGVMLSHKNLCSNIYSCSCVVPTFGDYTCLSLLPIHHTYEFTLDYLFMTAVGATIGVCQGLKYITKDLKEIKPDFILAVPAIIERFNQVIEKGIKETGKESTIKTIKTIANGFSRLGLDFRRKIFAKIQENFGGNLKYLFCGAAPLDPELITKMEGYGFKFLQGYGLTETSPLVTGTSLKCDASGTVGKAVEGVEVRIDLSKNEDENSNIGEIIVKGDNVMLGYYEDEEATKKVMKKSWFYTGDLGYFDLRGNLVITGRTKNVIVTANGKNIYPEELENLLNKMPLIAESMVYGKRVSKTSKDVIVAARVTLDNAVLEGEFGENIPSDDKLYNMIFEDIKKINRMMVSYKAIKELEIKKDDFEKTTTMKIKRYAELENSNYDNMITTESVNKIKASQKKEKRKVVNVEAKKKK